MSGPSRRRIPFEVSRRPVQHAGACTPTLAGPSIPPERLLKAACSSPFPHVRKQGIVKQCLSSHISLVWVNRCIPKVFDDLHESGIQASSPGRGGATCDGLLEFDELPPALGHPDSPRFRPRILRPNASNIAFRLRGRQSVFNSAQVLDWP